MPIRYMGTKRNIASRVQYLVADLRPEGRVLDLFSGIGCVAESLASVAPVHTNDTLSFTAVLARARFKGNRDLTPQQMIHILRVAYREQAEAETSRRRKALRCEQQSLDGGIEALAQYMRDAKHVATSPSVRRNAAKAAKASGPDHYHLMRYYFAAGYFSLRQAVHLDALRYAIDTAQLSSNDRDWAIAAWLCAAARLANAPGHTAQFLKSNNESSFRRIGQFWRRSVWETFQNELIGLQLVGTYCWREQNIVEIGEALELLQRPPSGVGAVYADPPYTKDQYSRYYHVYETMYRYDYPSSAGQGRVRDDRFTSSFCLKSQVKDSFSRLFSSVSDLGLPLILSYPSEGLLAAAGSSVVEIADGHMRLQKTETFGTDHSTLGASKGATTKSAMENIYVYVPN